MDYGCGKQTLKNSLPHFEITGYDPALPGLDYPPEPHDLVACTDVLEHIEPDLIENVLDDLVRVTNHLCILVISTTKAKKTLSDGRNAHLIIQPISWWIEKLEKRFTLNFMQNYGHNFFIVVERKRDLNSH